VLGQLIAPASLAIGLLASPAGARCIGSTDPVVERMELKTGRDPAAAVGLIEKQIAKTDPADSRRLAELYVAKSQALNMSGAPYYPALEKARSVGGRLGPTDNLGLYLRISEAVEKTSGAETAKALQSIAPDVEALPAASSAKTCRAMDLAFYNSMAERPREAMMFAIRAYRNAQDDPNSFERAGAASVLAFLVSDGHDFDYSNKLHSEAYAIQQELGLSDLAANEVLLRGYTHLDRGDWKNALRDFEASAREARSYGNKYAVDYALVGVCEAALDGEMTEQAAPACERAYEDLTVPGERMAVPATTLMARLLVEQGNPTRSLQLLDPLIAEGKGSASSHIWIMALKTRAQALSLLGRNKEAYAAMRQASAASDEFHDRELQSGVAALQARFQTEELQRRLTAEERASNTRLRLAIAVIVGTSANRNDSSSAN